MFKVFGVASEQKNAPDIDLEEINSDEEILDEEVWQVALDILETEDEIYIIAPIAGLDHNEINISIHKTVLTIKWNREKPEEYDIEWIKIRNTECFWGKFVRNIILPENLALNKIKSYMENNLLTITIPKLKFDSKSIKIDTIETKSYT